MEGKSLLMMVIIIVAALAVVAAICYVLLLEEPLVNPSGTKAPSEVIPPPATGNVDDAVDALLMEITDSESLFLQEENDISSGKGSIIDALIKIFQPMIDLLD